MAHITRVRLLGSICSTAAIHPSLLALPPGEYHVEPVSPALPLESLFPSGHETLTLSTQTTVFLSAAETPWGPALDVLHALQAVGSPAGFVAAGDFTREQVTELFRAGAHDVVSVRSRKAPTSGALKAAPSLDAAILNAARLARARAGTRSQIEQERTRRIHAERALAAACAAERRTRRSLLDGLLLALSVREGDSIAHARRVQAYTRELACAAGYPAALQPALEEAALLHDAGKLALPRRLLEREGWLTQQELRGLEPHAVFGAALLERIECLRDLAPIVRHHHERYDGHGLPDGLAGREIPLGARLFTIADALDAMTSDKPYRAAMTFEVAAEEIRRSAGTQFDPELVERFLAIPPATWRTIRQHVMEQHRGSPTLACFPETA